MGLLALVSEIDPPAVACGQAHLQRAQRPFKYVTNWCYARAGTVTLATMVRGWNEAEPHKGTLSDDIEAMYQNVDRATAFAAIRRRFPSLLASFRLFFATSAVIWFGGATVPIERAADGRVILGNAFSTEKLRSRVGGCQGLGGSTIFCVLPYHECLAHTQRLNPTSDIGVTADDSYIFDDISAESACEDENGEQHSCQLAKTFADKRRLAARMGLYSGLPKVAVYSDEGDLDAMPACVPGSPHHPTDSDRITNITVAGVIVGDDDACRDALTALITARLKPLDHVLAMEDTEDVANTLQLKLGLVRQVASVIFDYWAASMPPELTAPGAAHSDAVNAAAVAAIASAADSPRERAALALLCAAAPSKIGGLGCVPHLPALSSKFTSGFRPAWMECRRVNSTLAGLPVVHPTAAANDGPNNVPTPAVASFLRAYTSTRSALATVRHRHAALDQQVRHWVDGTTHTAFHPALAPRFELPSPEKLFDDVTSIPRSRLSMRSLAAIVNNNSWMDALQECHTFDSTNPAASTPHREATRHVSGSQEGAGAALARPPDETVRQSIVTSADFLILIQRRLGLYLSILASPLRAAADNGRPSPTEYQLLGDEYINAANKSHRHKQGLAALGNALRAVTPANDDGATVVLCDKGDGTHLSKEDARKRYAHLCSTHCPDAARLSSPPVLFEFKCYTAYNCNVALGHGSTRCGGAPSTADGHFIAFGCTEEDLRKRVLGLAQIGSPSTAPGSAFDRTTGTGYVAACDGDYADAIAKNHKTHLLVVETTGAHSAPLMALLRGLAAQATAKGAIDRTAYGEARHSPSDFVTHHVAAISAAVQLADTLTIRNAAATLQFSLSMSG